MKREILEHFDIVLLDKSLDYVLQIGMQIHENLHLGGRFLVDGFLGLLTCPQRFD